MVTITRRKTRLGRLKYVKKHNHETQRSGSTESGTDRTVEAGMLDCEVDDGIERSITNSMNISKHENNDAWKTVYKETKGLGSKKSQV